MAKRNQLFVIGGPNGSGKTISALMLMPTLIKCHEYINADMIAFGLSPFNPNSVSVKAGKLRLKKIRELAGMEDCELENLQSHIKMYPHSERSR